ncbi:unnamed protein product [Boreogadus saida]
MRPNSQQMARKRPLRKRPLRRRPLGKSHLGRGHLAKRPLGKTHLRTLSSFSWSSSLSSPSTISSRISARSSSPLLCLGKVPLQEGLKLSQLDREGAFKPGTVLHAGTVARWEPVLPEPLPLVHPVVRLAEGGPAVGVGGPAVPRGLPEGLLMVD